MSLTLQAGQFNSNTNSGAAWGGGTLGAVVDATVTSINVFSENCVANDSQRNILRSLCYGVLDIIFTIWGSSGICI